MKRVSQVVLVVAVAFFGFMSSAKAVNVIDADFEEAVGQSGGEGLCSSIAAGGGLKLESGASVDTECDAAAATTKFTGTLGFNVQRDLNTCFPPAKDCVSLVRFRIPGFGGTGHFDPSQVTGTLTWNASAPLEKTVFRCDGDPIDCYAIIGWKKQ